MTDLVRLSEHVRELVQPGQHVVAYRQWETTVGDDGKVNKNDRVRLHRSSQPSLLVALRISMVDQAQTPAQAAAGPAQTVPHLNTDAIDRYRQICEQARKWCGSHDLGSKAVNRIENAMHLIVETFPRWMQPMEIAEVRRLLERVVQRIPRDAEWDVRAIPGIMNDLTDDDAREMLARDVARWRAWCRIIAGWETPAWRPNIRCPECGSRPGEHDDRPTGLRIRLDERSAVCMSCNMTWGKPPLPSIDELADKIVDKDDEKAAQMLRAGLSNLTPTPGPWNRGGRS